MQRKAATKISSEMDEINLSAQTHRFPWAAKMDSSMRNLHQTTSPTYMEDGTGKVKIPNHALLKGLENQREFAIGQSYRFTTPSVGLVHAMENQIWGMRRKIFIRKLSETSYLFHIPDESTCTWVIHHGLWDIDDCLMFVAPWSPAATLVLPEISTILVWVTLKNIPSQLYSMQCIGWISSELLGGPMATNKPRLDPTLMGEAKILVEVELNKSFSQKIAAEDKKSTLSMIDLEYSWFSSKCGRCDQLGHKESRYLQKPRILDSNNVKDCPLPESQVSDSRTLDAPHHGPLSARDIATQDNTEKGPHSTSRIVIEAAENDILLANTTTSEVVPLSLEETTSIFEVVPNIITASEVHETITTVAEATHTIETTTSAYITLIPTLLLLQLLPSTSHHNYCLLPLLNQVIVRLT